jgi:hypothetical protein
VKKMRWVRVILAAGVFGGLVAAASRCATPTQLIVEVSTDAPCERLDTGIFVGRTSQETNASAGPVVAKRGCERPGFIGSSVFLPRGADDDAFAVMVVTGVDATVDECIRGTKTTCIVEHRAVRYQPGEIVRVSVTMDQQCVGVECGPKESCRRGTCIPCPDCEDNTVTDASVGDARPDVETFICPDGCTSCDAGTCIIDCKVDGGCPPTVTCPPNSRCEIDCSDHDYCKGTIDCAAAKSCQVICTGTEHESCHQLTLNCGTAACQLHCSGAASVCHEITVHAQSAPSFCLDCSSVKGVCDTVGAAPGACEAPPACQRICNGCPAQTCASCANASTCPPLP